MGTSGNRIVMEEAARREATYARHGGGLAAGMRRALGVEAVRKRVATASGLTGPHRAALNVAKSLLEEGEIPLSRYEGVAAEIYAASRGGGPIGHHTVSKSAPDPYGSGGPDDHQFSDPLAAALSAYGDLLAGGKADLDDVNRASQRVRDAVVAGYTGDPDQTYPGNRTDQPTTGGPSGTGGRRAVTPDSIPSGRGHGDGEATVVRKSAHSLIEKAADEVPKDENGEVEPLQVLARANAILLDTFRKEEGRDPTDRDKSYWQAQADLLREFAEAVREQA